VSKLAELFVISPAFEKKLHPEARRIFHDWVADIQRQVQLDEVTDDDLNFLPDNDKIKLKTSVLKIPECLNKCTGIKDGDKLYDIYIGDIFLARGVISELERDLVLIRWDIEPLLRKIYLARLAKAKEELRREEEKRKLAEAREIERKRKEGEEEKRKVEEAAEIERRGEEERWRAAHEAVNPAIDEAKRYLDRPGEYDGFIQAARQAIQIYLEKGEDYLDDSRTFDYRWCLEKIKDRKEEEQIRNDAQAQAQAFRARLAQGLKEIEKMLSPKKEDPAVIFKRWCSNNGENRYLGEPFTDILASDDDENRKWTQGYIPAAEAKLQQSIPEELRDFILTQPTAAFFLLPSAHYAYYGVPCLDFNFAVFAVVTITVLAQAGQKVFNGHKFNFLTNLREPKRLGFYQTTVIPNQPHFWQSVPLTILCALVDGNLQPLGTTILQRTDQLTVYEVKKFEEDICEIPVSFERYCRSLGSVEKMKEAQIINERTAEILEPLRPISINHKESKSKKAKAFLLFSQGKRPSDSEVKSLGIKPNSAYRYYQDWKKAHNGSNNRT